jgi:hypothetical protein
VMAMAAAWRMRKLSAGRGVFMSHSLEAGGAPVVVGAPSDAAMATISDNSANA